MLVVDDEPSFAGLLRDALSDLGHSIVVAGRPSEALARLAEGCFEVAVLDLDLPEMGGLELARRIRIESPDTEMVVLTGKPDLESAIEGIHEGVFDYLRKGSLRMARLARAVRGAAERRRLAIANRALLAELGESNRMLASLHQVTRELTGELVVDRVLQHVVRSARELLGAELARVLLFRRAAGGELVVEMAVGDGAETLQGSWLIPGEGVAAAVAQSQEPVLLQAASDHPAYLSRVDDVATALPGFVCAPIRYSGVLGALVVAGRRDLRPQHRDLVATLAGQAGVAIQNALYHDRAMNFFTHTSEILVSFLERLDPSHAGHPHDTAALADMLSRRAGLGDEERRSVHFGTLLRDIGRIRLPPELLLADSAPAGEQQRFLQQHPTLGLEMLRPISEWQGILPVVHAHHERWDGGGYPLGLSGDAIPLAARVAAIAEAFDFMTGRTTHGPRRAPQDALAELELGAGTRFDPQLVGLFVAEYRRRGDPRRSEPAGT